MTWFLGIASGACLRAISSRHGWPRAGDASLFDSLDTVDRCLALVGGASCCAFLVSLAVHGL